MFLQGGVIEMKRELLTRIIATLMLVVIFAIPVASGALAAEANENETRFVIDWTNVELTEGGTMIPYYAVLKSSDGYYFYMISNKEYDDVSIYVLYNDRSFKVINLVDKNGTKVYDGSVNEIEGASVITSYDEKARYSEVFIPLNYMGTDSFIITSQDNYYVLYEEVTGQDKGIIWSNAIKDASPYMAEAQYTPERPKGYDYVTAKVSDYNIEDLTGTYSGIVIDGSFSDWSAIAGQTTNFQNADLDAKIVWDADKIYGYIAIYGAEANDTLITGQTFYIQTDGGQIREFSFKKSSSSSSYYTGKVTMTGISGTEVAMDSETKTSGWWIFGNKTYYYYYEFSIPANAIGQSAQSVRFGIKSDSYDMPITDYTANLAPASSDDDDDDIHAADDIDIDGVFDDWSDFPYTYLYFCDQNHSNCPDGYNDYSHNGKTSGSAYIKDDKIVAHIKSVSKLEGNMVLTPYLTYIKIKVNDNYEITLVTTQKSTNGSYRTMIVHEEGNSTPLGEMVIYDNGKTLYEYEYYIDIEMLAERLGLGPTELRTIEIYYPYIGYQAVKVAGTSTAPYVGIAICFAIVALTWFIRYMKDKRTLG